MEKHLTGNNRMRLPIDTADIDARASQLASSFRLDHTARVELAAICAWRQRGLIDGRTVNELAAKSAGVSMRGSDEVLAELVYAVGNTVWHRLNALADDQAVLPADDHADGQDAISQHQSTMSWFKTVMGDAEQLIIAGAVSPRNFVDLVPEGIRFWLGYDERHKLFDGLCGTGAALHFYATGRDGHVGHQPQAMVYLADAMACALLYSITDLKNATEDDEIAAFGYQVALWWGLLKGFVYSGVHNTVGCYQFAAQLQEFPREYAQIVGALVHGLQTLQRQQMPLDMWIDGHTPATDIIARTSVDSLVATLQAAVVSAEREARAPRL